MRALSDGGGSELDAFLIRDIRVSERARREEHVGPGSGDGDSVDRLIRFEGF